MIDGNDRKKDLCTILLGGTRARLGLVEDARLINNKLSLGQLMTMIITSVKGLENQPNVDLERGVGPLMIINMMESIYLCWRLF